MNKTISHTLLATTLLLPFVGIVHAGDNREACSITLVNGYYEEDSNDNGYTYFYVYDGDDSALISARHSKGVAYGKSWNTYCEVDGQKYCKVRYEQTGNVGFEWGADALKVDCGDTYTNTDGTS